MPKYVIEREIPGAGNMTETELQEVSQLSCDVLDEMTDIEWIQSYVTGEKVYCIYNAASKDQVREHAKRGNFPANSIEEIMAIIDPSTAKRETKSAVH